MQVPLDQKLQSEAQWRVWIGHIKSAAVAEDVWDYLDPEKADDKVLQVPEAEEEPSLPRDNRQRERDIMELEDAELKRYTFAVQAYDRRDQRRQRLLKTMSRLNNLITRSLATEHHYLVVGEDSPRKKLMKLSETFKPKPQNRQQQLRRAWREMIRQKPSGDTNHWLTQWVSLFEEGRIAGIPDCSNGDQFAIRDFLDAIQSIDDTWCTAWREKLADQEKSVSFHEVIASYRSRRGDLAISSGRKQPKIALASLNDEPEAKPVEKTYRKKCPCGNTHPQHHFSKCFYLNESIRPEGWKPREGTLERIPEFIKQMSAQDQEKIAKIQQKKVESAHLAGMAPLEGQPLVFFANDTQAIASSAVDEDLLKNSWILDSGSTVHICNDREQFLTYAPRQSTVKTGKTETPMIGYGQVKITGRHPHTDATVPVTLDNVWHSPGFHTNLISLSVIEDKGFCFKSDEKAVFKGNEAVLEVQRHHGLYTVIHNPNHQAAFSGRHSEKPHLSVASARRWHRRLGHAFDQKIEKLPGMVDGVKIDGSSEDNRHDNPERCEVCQLTKAKRQISRRTTGTPYGKYGRIHFDLVQIDPGYNGDRWLTHFYLEGVRLHAAYTHEKKNGCQDAVSQFVALAQKQWNLPIRAFRYDNERSAGRTVEDFLSNEGFIIEHSVVGTPEQNGFAERSGGVIITMARALIADAGLPKNLWPEAVKAAVWIINRSPTKLSNGQWIVPYQEAFLNQPQQRANLANLRIFGCRAYVRKQGIPNAAKMEPRAEIGYLVGYEASNIWRVWFPHRGSVRSVRDVVFDENVFFNARELEKEPVSDILETMPWVIEENEDIDQGTLASGTSLDMPQLDDAASQRTESQGLDTPSQVKEATSQLVEPQQMMSPSPTPSVQPVQASEPHAAPRDIVGNISSRNIVSGSRRRSTRDTSNLVFSEDDDEEGVLAAFATGLNGSSSHTRTHRDDIPPEPPSWREMMNHPFNEGFLAAAGLEVKTIERKGTFEVVRRPNDRGVQVLPLKWVFNYKFDSDGYLVKLKARICVRGDLQKLSTEEKYSATLAARTARAVLALVPAFDLDTQQFDAVNAFLNSLLDETVITEMPEGFRQSGYCWKLLRALYGLRKSPRLWQREASKILTQLGLKVVQEDLCLFAADGIIVFFYVDDIIVVNHPSQRQRAAEITEKLNITWELRHMGEASWFLGIRIVRDRQQMALWLCQDSYISSMASRYHLTTHRRFDTPLAPATLKPYAGQATKERIKEYQEKIGSAQYATTITRPDAAKATSTLAQFLTNPGPDHLEAINRVISYLYHTRFHAITYRPRQSEEDEAVALFSDASFADNPDRKSSEGYICTIFGGPVDWRAGKQRTVTTSTTEAELLAISEAARTMSMWKRLFEAIRFNPKHELAIRCDNQQTIRLLTKEAPQLRTKLRHVDIHHHWLRQEVQAGRILIKWTETKEMAADGLTKLLPRQRHAEFIQMMGMEDIGNLLD